MLLGAHSNLQNTWLDVTRTLTRIGRGPATGIDRVEREYLKTFLSAGCDRYLCRTTRGYLLIDARGGQRLLELVDGGYPLGSADLLSKLTLRGTRLRHRAEAALRPFAIDRALRGRLRRLVDRQVQNGATYFNVGHSNLSEEVLSTFGAVGPCAVLVHDLIPITHPTLVADTLPEAFAGRMERVRNHSDVVITNSRATASTLATLWASKAPKPEMLVAHLGVQPAVRAVGYRDPLHFVMLGTIEPRKNHALIVDAWEALALELPSDRMPDLHIIGKVGWKVDGLMARLQTHPMRGKSIHIHGALSDAEVCVHLSKARALLFPSIAEGYGLPPLEAAMAGAVPLCSNLEVFRETIGDCGVYVNNPTAYQWKETIKQLIDGSLCVPNLTKVKRPTWQEHFEIVAEAVIARHARGRK